jgi:hypothetical protein
VLLLHSVLLPLRKLARSMSIMREHVDSDSVIGPLSWVCCFCMNGSHRNKTVQGLVDGWLWTLLMPVCVVGSRSVGSGVSMLMPVRVVGCPSVGTGILM